MIELRKHPRFVDETSKPGGKSLDVALGSYRDSDAVHPAGKRRRHVFLERDTAMQRVIVNKIDDAKAALGDELGNFELTKSGTHGKPVMRGRSRRRGRDVSAQHQSPVVGLRRGGLAHFGATAG